MRAQIERDKKRRKLFAKFEKKRLAWQVLARSKSENCDFLDFSLLPCLQESLLPRNSCKSRVRNRCIITGRSRGVFRIFKISRIRFRELALQGNITGIRKASW